MLTSIKTLHFLIRETFWCENREFFKPVGKIDKMLGRASHLIFSPTHLMNSIIHERSYKILYIDHRLLSGVPRGTVLGPLLFSLYINDISSDIESEIRLFADDCVCYREIKDEKDTMKLQRDIDRLGSWARKWGMRFQPGKCNMMQLTRKRIKKIHASYTLEGTNLENVESIKYLGVTISSDLRWNTHVSNVCTKANRTLGFLRRKLYSCPQEVKEAAYKGLVRPVLDYGSSVWDPPQV